MRPDWIAVAAFLAILAAVYVWKDRSIRKVRDVGFPALKSRGVTSPIDFGLCVAGLPLLEKPTEVYGGVTSEELIFVAIDGRELGRIPLSALQIILSGDAVEVGPFLPPRTKLERFLEWLAVVASKGRFEPTYVVLEWVLEDDERRHAAFRFSTRMTASTKELVLRFRKELAPIASLLKDP